jgi:hypothetical protein
MPTQIDELAAKTKQAASSGKYELYNTSLHFDFDSSTPGLARLNGPPAGVSE